MLLIKFKHLNCWKKLCKKNKNFSANLHKHIFVKINEYLGKKLEARLESGKLDKRWSFLISRKMDRTYEEEKCEKVWKKKTPSWRKD